MYTVEHRKPNDWIERIQKKFPTLKDAEDYIFKTIKENDDFYKTAGIDYGHFDIEEDFEYGKSSTVIRYIITRETYPKTERIEIEEDLVDHFMYKGVAVNVYEDDYGQCYYYKFKWNDEIQHGGCGTYNLEYKDYISSEIDYMLEHESK